MVIAGSSSSSSKIKPPPPDWVVESAGDAVGSSCTIGPSSGEQAALNAHNTTAAIALMHNDNPLFLLTEVERGYMVLL